MAVKVIDRSLADDEEIVARFRQEQALGARLRHPNLIAVYEAGHAAGRPYLVMEFVEGDNLDGFVGRYGPLPVAEACEVVRQAALGLQHLHEHGLVHRDVKPSNLMLTPAGEVKVLDLGLARHLHEPGAGEQITRPGSSWALSITWRRSSVRTRTRSTSAPTSTAWAAPCTSCWRGSRRSPARLRVGVPEDEGPRRGAGAADPGAPARCPRAARRALGRMLAKDREGRFASPADVIRAVQPFAAGAELAVLAGAPAVADA